MAASWEGNFFEDFREGQIYRHSLGRTITEADNVSSMARVVSGSGFKVGDLVRGKE